MALVNAYIIHRDMAKKLKDTGSDTHGQWIKKLSKQLCRITASDFLDNNVVTQASITNIAAPTLTGNTHELRINDENKLSGRTKPRTCHVCSFMSKIGASKLTQNITPGARKRSYESTVYCVQCSNDPTVPDKRMFLCTKPRDEHHGRTCNDVWHHEWKCKLPSTQPPTQPPTPPATQPPTPPATQPATPP
jgi:hypothetical protein